MAKSTVNIKNTNAFLVALPGDDNTGQSKIKMEVGKNTEINIAAPQKRPIDLDEDCDEADQNGGTATNIEDAAVLVIAKEKEVQLKVDDGAVVNIGLETTDPVEGIKTMDELDTNRPRKKKMTDEEKGYELIMSIEEIISVKNIRGFARFFGLKENTIDVIEYNNRGNGQQYIHQILLRIVKEKKPTAADVFAKLRTNDNRIYLDHVQKVFTSFNR